jgi:2-dehydro-3-deoxygluconokinase
MFLKDVRPDGERHVFYYRSTSAASAMEASDAARGLATQPRAVLLSGLTSALGPGPRRMAEQVAATARQRGIRVALDANLRPQLGRLSDSIDSVRSMLPSVEFLIVGIDDARALFDEDEPDRVAAAGRAAGCAEVVVTAGPRGSWWQDQSGRMIHQETLATTIVDPVGAGDAFTGAYLAGRLAGLPPRSSCWLGSAFAAAVIAAPGDTVGLPSTGRARDLLCQAAQLQELNA